MHLRAHWPRLRRAHLHTRGDVQTHACRHRRQDHRRRIDASGTTASIRLGSSRRRRREHEALSGNRGALLERGSRIAKCWLQGAHGIPFSLLASLLTRSEERRGGKGGVRTRIARGAADHLKKKTTIQKTKK